MNVNSGGPHILLFERDQQLTALLSGELTLAGYEVHTARTAVEVFDAIARFSVRLVMVNLAQAQASRREFWVALDAQRRGRGVQVFTFRCTNVGGYGPDDPDERIDTVLTDLEVDGMLGIVKLVDAVRARIPGSVAVASPPPSPRPVQAPAASMQEDLYRQGAGRFIETPQSYQAPPTYQASPAYQVSPVYPPQMYSPAPMQAMSPAPMATSSQHMQATLHPLPQELPLPAPSTPSARPPEPPRSGLSTFTDKIRAVIYPSSRSYSSAPEAGGPVRNPAPQAQNIVQYQNPDVQPRLQVSQRFAEADYAPAQINREDIIYQPARNPQAPVQAYPTYTNPPPGAGGYAANGESGLDQLSRMLRENQLAQQNAMMNGNMQNASFQAGLNIEQQQLQDIRSQVIQAARLDEAYGRAGTPQPRAAELASTGNQLRASPIQDLPFDREMAGRRGTANEALAQAPESSARPAMTALQPTQIISPAQAQPPATFTPEQALLAAAGMSAAALSPVRPTSPPETPASAASSSQVRPLSPVYEASPQVALPARPSSDSPNGDGGAVQPDQGQNGQQLVAGRRPPEVRTSDDMLLDIVKSLPPMAPAPQPPQPQPQVLNGRATRSLGSVLLEGHLVPQERLQVAQHVQRMLRGVDLNYQLGEILLMFKLLTPDQLLAASLLSYGMISTIQISALGRIRQELHAMGLEYDLESLLVLFRIITPEQLREVRASWSS